MKKEDIIQRFRLEWQDKELFEYLKHATKRNEIRSWLGSCKNKTLLLLCDLHIPFINLKALTNLFRQKKRFDIVLLLGDTLDLYRLSRFRKSLDIDEKMEFEALERLLSYACRMGKKVIVVLANHEKRITRVYQDLLRDPKLFDLIKNSIYNIFNRFETNKIRVLQDWWIQIGDVVFCHPDWYLMVQGQTVKKSEEHFSNLGNEFKAIFNAHVHKYIEFEHRRKWLYELPCMSNVMDYQVEGKRTFKPMDVGWLELRFNENGKFDVNGVRRYIVN